MDRVTDQIIWQLVHIIQYDLALSILIDRNYISNKLMCGQYLDF